MCHKENNYRKLISYCPKLLHRFNVSFQVGQHKLVRGCDEQQNH